MSEIELLRDEVEKLTKRVAALESRAGISAVANWQQNQPYFPTQPYKKPFEVTCADKASY
jgi:hypothetical protein